MLHTYLYHITTLSIPFYFSNRKALRHNFCPALSTRKRNTQAPAESESSPSFVSFHFLEEGIEDEISNP